MLILRTVMGILYTESTRSDQDFEYLAGDQDFEQLAGDQDFEYLAGDQNFEYLAGDQDFEYLAGLYFSYVFYTNNLYTIPILYNESARSDQDFKVLADFILFLFLISQIYLSSFR